MLSRYILRIVVPTLLTVALFIVTICLILLPALERGLMGRKREMIREMTTSAWNILASFEQEAAEGRMTLAMAQEEAFRQFRNLYYGPQMKDYFWINDLTPRMACRRAGSATHCWTTPAASSASIARSRSRPRESWRP
jgi:hypothetical protein